VTERTYTDKDGHVIGRAEAIDAAVRCMLDQGDARDVVREHMEGLSDAELMVWLVYPDTGEFAHLPEHRV
jgi:hypothetical protein